jgi:hypothetical protein
MAKRWTNKELETYTDNEMLRVLVQERQNSCTNIYSPLYQRLSNICHNLDKQIEQKKSKER